jgi:hypothetical protein
MAESYEILVRPYIPPAIRPERAQPIVPKDDPAFGQAVIGGSSGQIVKLTLSEQSSWSRSHATETRRQVDVERVYQKKPPTPEHPKGEIDKENYVDVERMKKLEMQGGNGELLKYDYALPSPSDNIELIEGNKWIINANAPSPEGDTEEGGTPP